MIFFSIRKIYECFFLGLRIGRVKENENDKKKILKLYLISLIFYFREINIRNYIQMDNFIFSTKEIFSVCLSQNEVEGYYIAPYQRGYKWKSTTKHDHVPVLLTDLFEAYLKSNDVTSSQEYFLQYITVKKTVNQETSVFEVIDGQQRLTTLSLLFSVLGDRFRKKNIAQKCNKYLLNYARYEGNELHIFDEILNTVKEDDLEVQEVEEQDKYYMILAVKRMQHFFDLIEEEDKEKSRNHFKEFVDFIENNVKIILNKEDEFTSAEEVFSSLNANQVPLTNAYLIKGLLLTKASRGFNKENKKKGFREIMDERAIMGRMWDEMNTWFGQPEIGLYFFQDKEAGLERMLHLIKFDRKNKNDALIKAFRRDLKQGENNYISSFELFNEFHDHIITAEDAQWCLGEVKHIYKRLKNWYNTNLIYNLLGYKLYYKLTELPELLEKDNVVLIKELKEFADSMIPIKAVVEQLNYKKNQNSLEQILLLLSIFPEGISLLDKMDYRFKFHQLLDENWSLEHIYPQSLKGKEIDIESDRPWIIEKLKVEIEKESQEDGDSNRILELKKLLTEIKEKNVVSIEEIGFLSDDFSDKVLHSLGNMALLSGSVNASLSNGLFNKKRKILLKRINQGHFVPKHTVDVFSKMLEMSDDTQLAFDTTLINWTKADIEAHQEWITNRLENLKNELAT